MSYVSDVDGIIIGFFKCIECKNIFKSSNNGFEKVPERTDGKIYTIYKEIVCSSC